MKMNAPGTPPAHRLPVLTEVIQLTAAVEEPVEAALVEVDFPLPVDEPVAIAVPAPVPVPAPEAPRPEPVPAPEPVLAEQPVPFAHDAPAPPEWLKRRPAPHVRVGLPLPAMAPPSPLPADFSGSWWSRDEGPAVVSAPVPVPVPIPAPVRPVETVSEDVLVQRVFEGLEGQIDLMFDHRMREAVVPALARAADSLMADLKEQLHATLHEMVSRAVAIELARQAHRRESGS
ncbi:hypothetical protein [Piscinibacter gummiphilus]|uniref:Uncharacterized protein n=1 Tax=Piscinibacter gummiphilus TaxID=946333 RepID=A0A1W6L9J2_9BURK|nr:hypothetical protein [Piscinibacter gummiphilus]ARN20837.1 hypothetical protein A4W93_13540 [Piscinibacter gummiphilus]ATU65515.1 hypothetical protein CPZ87_13615 [Piscinibacter gummiphilus]GLS94672.1 hypothetical protein GCM10007918_19640 [Piscinibacter gummiphilus]